MNVDSKEPVRLTEYSRGAGCGCKIAPQTLREILDKCTPVNHTSLLVGNSSNDDAAVYDLNNGMALIATTDFFMPIVDSAFLFGKIAAANAISDVYAMGGTPALAVAILGWPVEKLPPALAGEVMQGAKAVCDEADIPLAGGHSIDSAEPFFGLAVNGMVAVAHLKRNNTAKKGDLLFLTRPLGVGILSTAQKRKVIREEDVSLLESAMTQLNRAGEDLGKVKGVTAMTDVTGFGLAGHLIEMAEGSGLSCQLHYSHLPVHESARHYLSQNIIPDATYRNWNSYQNKIKFENDVAVMEAFSILPDPQTNGGLLIAVDRESTVEVKKVFDENGLENFIHPIGSMTEKSEAVIYVKK